MMTVDFVALGHYLNGQASQEERAVVEAWLGADAERRAAVAALQAVWAADARQYEPSYDTDAAWRRLRRALARTARPARSVAWRARPGPPLGRAHPAQRDSRHRDQVRRPRVR